MNDQERNARIGLVTTLFDHYGRQPSPQTIVDVVRDTESWRWETLRTAAERVRRTVQTLHGASLSAHLLAEARQVAREKASEAEARRALPPPREQMATAAAMREAVARIEKLSRRMGAP